MKFLTLIRHAKSSWSQPGMADHERPLNPRGNFAAPLLGRFLGKTYFGAEGAAPLMTVPQQIVASTAVRTLETARHMAAAFNMGLEQIRLDSRLYLAEPRTLLQVVRGFDEDHQHVILIAHNPGIHEFSDGMLARASVPDMPTCGTVMLGLPVEHWGLADFRSAQLIAHITPKLLERRFPSEWAPGPKEAD